MVAVVDDDESFWTALPRLLRSAGFRVRSFASAEDFLKSGQRHETGCLVADIRMPGMSGLDLQAKLDADHCAIPTIFISAHHAPWQRQHRPGCSGCVHCLDWQRRVGERRHELLEAVVDVQRRAEAVR